MQYQNPIIRGFSPDPSICRVGEDYYLVNSSFEYFPGIPIYHSRDLVNWTQIGNCISWENPLPLTGVPESGGVWAPTIRYHEGYFFVTAAVENYGNFIVSAPNPAGPWSEPCWIKIGGIDPSLFFEDGKAYYCTTDSMGEGREGIALGVVDPFTGQILEPFQVVWHGTGGGCLESPHIYHIGDWYYVLTAEGGTFFSHMITVGRSRRIGGPYEACPDNPILTNREDVSWQVLCTGHGDMVQDTNGNWWMVHLATRMARRTMSHLGRETFLTPFIWQEGWPVFAHNKKAQLLEEGPIARAPEKWKGWSDDFADDKWNINWRMIRNPHMECYERGEGVLVLHPVLGNFEELDSPAFACVRQQDFELKLEVKLHLEAQKEGDEAGICVYHTHAFHYRFGLRQREGKTKLFVEKKAEDFRQTVYEQEIQNIRNVHLVLTTDKLLYHFAMEMPNGSLQEIATASTRFLANEVVGRSFTGTMLGLYAAAKEDTRAAAEFREFAIENLGE